MIRYLIILFLILVVIFELIYGFTFKDLLGVKFGDKSLIFLKAIIKEIPSNAVGLISALVLFLLVQSKTDRKKKKNRIESLKKEIRLNMKMMKEVVKNLGEVLRDTFLGKTSVFIHIDDKFRYKQYMFDKLVEEGDIWDITDKSEIISGMEFVINEYNKSIDKIERVRQLYNKESTKSLPDILKGDYTGIIDVFYEIQRVFKSEYKMICMYHQVLLNLLYGLENDNRYKVDEN